MLNVHDNIELIKRAQLGDKESISRLSQLSGQYLHVYIYRLTLDYALTEDIVQDSLMEILRFLDKLREPQSYVSWIRRIAVNKMNSHYKRQKSQKTIPLPEDASEFIGAKGYPEGGLPAGEFQELSEIIMDAMRHLKPHQRQVLVMRCFEDLSYAQIASEMSSSEFNVRIIFFRAKSALRKLLMNRNISKGMLLPALCLFGKITQTAKTEKFTVASESLETGMAASVVGFLAARMGIVFFSGVLLAVLLTVITIPAFNKHNDVFAFAYTGTPSRSQVMSFYYMEQDWGKTGQFNQNLTRGRSLSKGCYEQWFYFPEGIDGPMFMMMQRWEPDKSSRLCGWLQNGSGNYYYYSGKQTIYLYNYHLPLLGLRTRRFPTDAPEFTGFLDIVEGKIPNVNFYRDPNSGILVGAMDNRFYNAANYKYQIAYNTLEKSSFDKFRYPWPQNAPVVDERDAMHKRGWTYFRITGKIGQQTVSGRGRMPFIYDMFSEKKPWMEIDVGKNIKITDSYWGSFITGADGDIKIVFPAGSFFAGLARPWMGIHTVDIVRRDAAEKKIWFSTQSFNYNEAESQYENARIILFDLKDNKKPVMEYLVNVTGDFVDRIDFKDYDGSSVKGHLTFTYLQDIEQVKDEFIEPEKIRLPEERFSEGMGILWLMKLSNGGL